MNIREFIRLSENIPESAVDVAIDEYVKGLHSRRNRIMLKEKLFENMTYEKIAEKHDMSVRQVKNIISDSAQQIVNHLGIE